MQEQGFTQCDGDPCIFVKYTDDGQLCCAVAVYVDDIIITAETQTTRNEIKSALSSRYRMTDMGKLSWYLGIQVLQTNESILLSQSNYTEATLERFEMQNCKPTSTPMFNQDLHRTETKAESENNVHELKYRSLIGCLMYLSVCTRPDITYAVNKLARFVSNPSQEHWAAAKRVLRYLKGTINLGLRFNVARGEPQPVLTGYADASWADSDNGRASTTGFLFQLGECTIIWASFAQRAIARSTTEAEYCALSDAAKEAHWIQRVLLELGAAQPTTVIYQDNQSCMTLAQGESRTDQRTKHIDTRYHQVRQRIQDGTIQVAYLQTNDMTADIFTKPLTGYQFIRLRERLGLFNISM
jgi:hypothetical protein